jgi:hypothetical protein
LQCQPLLPSPERPQKLGPSYRPEAERLVRAQRVVIAVKHPKQQLGRAHPTFPLGQRSH